MPEKTFNQAIVAPLIIALLALGNAGSTLYLPALIDIGEKIGAQSSQMQMTLACYLITFGISQFFYGPLSDAFGRKIILSFGVFVFIIGTLITAFSVNILMFMGGRLIEGFGIGATTAVGFATIRDVYQGNALSKILSYSSVFVGMTPILAPCVGGIIVEYVNWQACFYFLGLVAVILFLLLRCKLGETNQHIDPKAISLKVVSKNFGDLFSSGNYLGNVLATSFAFAGAISINNMMPFLITKQFNLTPSFYGLMTIFTGGGYFTGAFVAGLLAPRIGRLKTLYYGILLQFLVIICSFLYGYENLSLTAIILTFAIYLHGVGLVIPTGTGGSMEPFPQIAGSEAALLGAFMYSFSAFFSAFCSHVPKTSLKYTIILLCVLSVCTFLSTLPIKKQ